MRLFRERVQGEKYNAERMDPSGASMFKEQVEESNHGNVKGKNSPKVKRGTQEKMILQMPREQKFSEEN